jgi:uroporphyrinogen decarboxylase
LGRKGDFPDAIKFIYQNKDTTRKLIEQVTDLSVVYAQGQINHGVDVFQLFDTHAGLIPVDLYQELFMPSIRRMADAVRQRGIPFIFFPKGLGVGISEITPEDCDYLSIDWQVPIETARKLVDKEIGLQGNIDPRLLYAAQPEIEKALQPYVEFGKKNQNWIFNLGHGFMPGISFENARFLADWVKNTDWAR